MRHRTVPGTSRRRAPKSSLMSELNLFQDSKAITSSKRGYHAPNSAPDAEVRHCGIQQTFLLLCGCCSATAQGNPDDTHAMHRQQHQDQMPREASDIQQCMLARHEEFWSKKACTAPCSPAMMMSLGVRGMNSPMTSIPERQVQDAKRAQVDRHPVAKQKAPHKLFVYVMARRLVNHVLALEGYVYVGLIRLIPVLQAIDKV